jgi:hypothetical protein
MMVALFDVNPRIAYVSPAPFIRKGVPGVIGLGRKHSAINGHPTSICRQAGNGLGNAFSKALIRFVRHGAF